MRSTRSLFLFVLGLGFACILNGNAGAQEPGWASDIVVNGPVRQQVESTPVVQRPYRPLHFYGNTVRRVHYRGTPLPAPRDFRQGIQVVMRRPYVPVDAYLNGGR